MLDKDDKEQNPINIDMSLLKIVGEIANISNMPKQTLVKWGMEKAIGAVKFIREKANKEKEEIEKCNRQ